MTKLNRTIAVLVGVGLCAIALARYSGVPQSVFGMAQAQSSSAQLSYSGAARRTTSNQSYYATGPGRYCAQVISPMGGMTTQCP